MSHHNDSEGSDEGEWLDVEPDEEAVSIQSLLDSRTFPTAKAMLDHCKQEHGFDFGANIQRLQLDFLGAVKLVNFIRDCTKRGVSLPKEVSHTDIEDERFLQPVLENDALIFSLDDVIEADQIEGPAADKEASSATLLARNRELEAELEMVQSQFANYRLAVQETLDRRWGDDVEPTPKTDDDKKDSSDYYFESYAAHGESAVAESVFFFFGQGLTNVF